MYLENEFLNNDLSENSNRCCKHKHHEYENYNCCQLPYFTSYPMYQQPMNYGYQMSQCCPMMYNQQMQTMPWNRYLDEDDFEFEEEADYDYNDMNREPRRRRRRRRYFYPSYYPYYPFFHRPFRPWWMY